MPGKRGRRLVVVVGVLAVLGVGGGAAYALTPTSTNAAPRMAAQRPALPPGQASQEGAAASASASAQPVSPSAPPSSPAPVAPSAPAAAADPNTCPTGEYQRDVEAYLAEIGSFGTVSVDGVQSETDCGVIKAFQRRFGIDPANGRAGPVTVDVARRIATSITPAELAKCAAGPGVTFCIDLTMQTAWAVRDGAVVFGPTVVRTGMPGYATPAGTYRVYGRSTREWSKPYKVWLPYWQAFNGGIGLHETTTYLHTASMGSHGCVNLLHTDAVAAYDLGAVGTTVQVFGRRSGT